MEDSVLRIAVCDDDKGDREKVFGLVKEYLDEKKVIAQVKVFGSGPVPYYAGRSSKADTGSRNGSSLAVDTYFKEKSIRV